MAKEETQSRVVSDSGESARVSDRWIPVMAAAVGVLGGMGGALIGGYVANQGQEQRFQAEREASMTDLRRETYATYLRAADRLLARWTITGGSLRTEKERSEFLEAELIPIVTAQAAVDLVANDEVQHAAVDITNAFRRGTTDAEYVGLRAKFVDVAQEEITFPNE
jgi:hypothetical protein